MSNANIRRKAKQLTAPPLEEDPAERKRILNILAQRRYRRRRKEHVQCLERQTHDSDFKDSSSDSPTSQQPHTPTADGIASPLYRQSFEEVGEFLYIDPATSSGRFPLHTGTAIQDYDESTYVDPKVLEAFTASFPFPLPSLPSSPSESFSVASQNEVALLDHDPLLYPSFDESLGMDEVHLPMLELNLLRGVMAIANRMGVETLMWSIDADSLFHSSPSMSYTHLPANFWPTKIQVCNAHHPVLDILPWPSVREKLILVLSQPPELRPPNARTTTALLDLVYDMEDSAEGIRIWGDDPCDAGNWEVGKKLFKNWWWALNSDVVNQSNEMRRNRGAALLGIDRDAEEVE